MNSSPRPYLKVTRLASTQRGMRSTSSCSTLTHSTGPMPSGKSKTSGSLKGAVVNQPRSFSQTTGGLRHSSIVVHIEKLGAKISLPSSSWTARLAPSRVPELVDLVEEVVGGIAGEDVGEPRLDADADEGEPTVGLPLPGHGELLVTEHDADLLEGLLGVSLRQAHRHVEVVGPGRLGAVEDRHVELRVDGVEDVGRPVLARECRHRLGRRGVDLGRDEPALPRMSRPATAATVRSARVTS